MSVETSRNYEITVSDIINSGTYSSLNLYFAKYITEISNEQENPYVFLACAETSRHLSNGHVCVELAEISQKQIGNNNLFYPNYKDWILSIKKSKVVGTAGEYRPLILDNNKLYLHKFWVYETHIVNSIQKRIKANTGKIDFDKLSKSLKELFKTGDSNEINWQRIAAFNAVVKNISIISGGPGTGKTYTTTLILFLILEQNINAKIALVAPTGKAASKLKNSIIETLPNVENRENIKAKIPTDVQTIHRFLGATSGSMQFTYNKENKKSLDVLIMDESSMSDIALTSKLFEALDDHTKIILLGDKDQLSSVEAGSVFGDICKSSEGVFSPSHVDLVNKICNVKLPAEKNNPISDCVVILKKNHRFNNQSGIKALSDAVRDGNVEKVFNVLESDNYSDVTWHKLPLYTVSQKKMHDIILNGFKSYIKETDMYTKFNLLDNFRILCAVKESNYGTKFLNDISIDILLHHNILKNRTGEDCPVIIKRNCYNTKLFNGDVGLVLRKETFGKLSAFFKDSENNLRSYSLSQLPENETVFAMTIHKSQGSEFKNVALFLPDKGSPILTRELLYTGITRAKKRIDIFATKESLLDAVNTQTQKISGITDRLKK